MTTSSVLVATATGTECEQGAGSDQDRPEQDVDGENGASRLGIGYAGHQNLTLT